MLPPPTHLPCRVHQFKVLRYFTIDTWEMNGHHWNSWIGTLGNHCNKRSYGIIVCNPTPPLAKKYFLNWKVDYLTQIEHFLNFTYSDFFSVVGKAHHHHIFFHLLFGGRFEKWNTCWNLSALPTTKARHCV